MKNKITWPDYYKNRVNNEEYLTNFMKKYSTFINLIIYLKDNFNLNIKEEGVGIGTVSKLIKMFTLNNNMHLLSDNNEEMLELAFDNLTDYFKGDRFLKEDILSDTKGYMGNSLVITHGVLEHFDDKSVRRIIEGYNTNHKVVCHIHYVPTDLYETKSFGDERLLSKEYWTNLINPTFTIVDNKGYDIYLVTFKDETLINKWNKVR